LCRFTLDSELTIAYPQLALCRPKPSNPPYALRNIMFCTIKTFQETAANIHVTVMEYAEYLSSLPIINMAFVNELSLDGLNYSSYFWFYFSNCAQS